LNPWYTDYSEYLARFYGATKVQKLSVNTNSGCPNRDGTIGTGGCIYCNNASFTPGYCLNGGDVKQQLENGKRFFGRKYDEMKYLAYFQSYTNTHGHSVEELREIYETAMRVDDVVGLIIGTRPDCIDDGLAELLANLSIEMPIFVELGVETLCDETLKLINRGHDSQTSRDTISRLAKAGLHVGVHLIAGLPGEDKDRFLQTVEEICRLPVESIKMHHLQVLNGTPLAGMIEKGEIAVASFNVDEYLEICIKAIKRVPRCIAIERFLASAPPDMVISPKWGLKNYQFTNRLHNLLKELDKNGKTDEPE
jgi:hypothetical protein